jgi:hypothetical protein
VLCFTFSSLLSSPSPPIELSGIVRYRPNNSSSSNEIFRTDTETDAADATYKIDLIDVDTDANRDEIVIDEDLNKKDHPPEYYITCVEEGNNLDLIEEDYAYSSTL